MWRTRGLEVWNKFYAPRHALNLGIGGDRTQHVLWRIKHGELDGLKPKAVVLMIGTNNSGKERHGPPRNSTEEVVEGITAVVKAIRAKLPRSKLLLLAVFPRGTVDGPGRAQRKEINTAIAKLEQLHCLPELLLQESIIPDFLPVDFSEALIPSYSNHQVRDPYRGP